MNHFKTDLILNYVNWKPSFLTSYDIKTSVEKEAWFPTNYHCRILI